MLPAPAPAHSGTRPPQNPQPEQAGTCGQAEAAAVEKYLSTWLHPPITAITDWAVAPGGLLAACWHPATPAPPGDTRATQTTGSTDSPGCQGARVPRYPSCGTYLFFYFLASSHAPPLHLLICTPLLSVPFFPAQACSAAHLAWHCTALAQRHRCRPRQDVGSQPVFSARAAETTNHHNRPQAGCPPHHHHPSWPTDPVEPLPAPRCLFPLHPPVLLSCPFPPILMG